MAKYNQWMKFSIGDYLADTSHLTAQQHGIYMLLIMHYWRNESLPDNEMQLFVITKAFSDDIQEDVKYIVSTFFKNGNQKRLDKEISTAKEKYEKRVNAQKRSVEKRMSNSNVNCNANDLASSNALACASSCSSLSISNKDVKELFQKFYTTYPVHVKKADTLKWFKKHKPDKEMVDMMITKLKEQIEWRDSQSGTGVFIPQWPAPVVWLNGERWEDEIQTQDGSGDIDYLKGVLNA